MTQQEISRDLSSIQKLMSSQQFDKALSELLPLLGNPSDAAPDTLSNDAEALYMAAVCYRYKKDYIQAQALLKHLITIDPNNGRAHQEQGHLFIARKQLEPAASAFARACKINPALSASWQAQATIFSSLGNQPAADQAKAQLARLQATPKHLIAATDLLSQGKFIKAENLCRQFLQKNPQHIEGMRLLADIGQHLGALDEAEFLLESAAAFEPGNQQVRIDYIGVLRKRQRFAEALNEAQKLLAQAPENPQFQSIVAIELMQTADYDGAIHYFDEVLKRLPNDAITLTSKGHALKTQGHYQQAVDSYKSALSARPQHGEAYYSLANLKTYPFSKAEIDRMHQQEGSTEHTLMERVYLYFALGKAYEDSGDFNQSFEYYQLGNKLKSNSSGYDAEKMTTELMAQREVCTAELFATHQTHGYPAADPIFILGLPRAGSTMLEQILSSHSQVDGTLELPNILSMAQKLRRKGGAAGAKTYPEILTELNAEALHKLGEQFIADTQIHREGALFFIDKMPNNFRHIGLIKLILPNAKIIDARRHPMACCFSAYKQLFAEGQAFSYDLKDVGQYYSDYVNLMDHWDTVLPGHILRVHYEQVVEDLEGQVRRILDYCGLPFEEACLSFHETKRSVRTASSEQVRQPIYREGLEQWQNYSAQLNELETQLADVIRNYPS
ncbi:MAG: tetratricopeptide (TPR) repeat protein [Gammaproteobacteria bacterium]